MKRRQFVTSVLAAGMAAPVLAAGQHDHGDAVDGPMANATVSFGQWHTTPPLDRFPNSSPIDGNVHKLIPFDTKIKAGGTINFIISGFHLVTVYGPGTEFEDISTAVLSPIPGAPAGFPPVVNDPAVTAAALPVFERLVGKDHVREISLQTTADDYSLFAQQVPSLYFWIGITPPDRDPAKAAFNHSPLFYLDEAGMNTGVRALLALTTEYLAQRP